MLPPVGASTVMAVVPAANLSRQNEKSAKIQSEIGGHVGNFGLTLL